MPPKTHFFFQAEDGIRDRNVTGVQTCALPILGGAVVSGTPKQQTAADFATIFGFQWTQAAFEVLHVNAPENWTLTIKPDSSTTLTYTASAGTVTGLTSALADLIDTRFLPVVSGYTVSFNT